MSLQRECTFILALLLILAGASWAVLIWQSSMMKSMGLALILSGILVIVVPATLSRSLALM